MRLIGCVNAYHDAALLARSLPALRRIVDLLVVADGVYAGFPVYDPRPYSTDGSLDVAGEYADVVVLPPFGDAGLRRPWATEVEKRNAYLVGRPGDYYLVVDADEVVEVIDGVIARAKISERDDWLVMLKRIGESMVEYPIHRLFRHRDGIRYHGTHHAVHVGEPPALIHPSGLEADAPASVFPGLRLAHLWNQRDQDRAERKARYYQDVLVPSETEFRARHGLGLKQDAPRRSKAGV